MVMMLIINMKAMPNKTIINRKCKTAGIDNTHGELACCVGVDSVLAGVQGPSTGLGEVGDRTGGVRHSRA
eukprot:3219461-Amphidinium_carterae.1